MKRPTASGWFHLLAATWVGAMLWLGSRAPEWYRMLLQEDRVVEWGTVWLFLVAGVLGLRRSLPARRVCDGMVALFCLFVAGEEFSWGQRLLGYFPPEFFLRYNVQQELSVHNLPQSVQPGSVLMVALAGYGLLLPLLARITRTRALLERVRVTPPHAALVPWYGAAILLLWWYPFTLTGEWVELLAGGLFMMSTRPAALIAWPALVLTVAFGAAMTSLAGALERGRDETRLACAAAEVRRLAEDLVFGRAGTDTLWRMRRVHKRVWSSITDGYLDAAALPHFGGVACGESADAADVRHRYGIDPWGSPYWLLIERPAAREWRVTVYSFGPNRRRDVTATPSDDRHDGRSRATFDDVAATQITRLPASD
ncbi:MAG: hypothetical protein ACRD3C_07580 [Vicinamibacterales bacterium]